jgi:hypothetical protein
MTEYYIGAKLKATLIPALFKGTGTGILTFSSLDLPNLSQ